MPANPLAKTDRSAMALFLAATAFFFVGGLMTTVVPALTEDAWSKPVAGLRPLTEQEQRGRDIYKREGCWYCHTQQVRTLEADVKRFGWRGVDAPISTPGEYVNDSPHLLGTRRIGPDLSRVGGKYDRSWHLTHFRNPRDLVPGSIMPPFPWLTDRDGGKEFEDLLAYIQTLGRATDWRPQKDYEK
ncbi:MAG: cbb3-type cytochrome c oxidase subunit II [Planctomycetes bacterium]|nr:cbb3-type cytochrome c oxidase subunit II [Planctomycetota bacterium]